MMINIMIYVIMLEKEFEFKLDVDAAISELADEIAEMICQKEQCEMKGSLKKLMLFSIDRKMILPANSTLRACGIKTGDTLYFG